ncbi:MAG: hypothetical protein IKV72_07290 [Firmicutes bacterium]|nr:hypothetical protein [Bacillota bacterium]
MENFKAYFKMNLSQIVWELVCMLVLGFTWWFVAETLFLLIAFPLIVWGIVYCSQRVDRKLVRDSIQGKTAYFYMSLPVGTKAMILTKCLLQTLNTVTVAVSLVLPMFGSMFGSIFSVLCRNLVLAVGWEEQKWTMGTALVINFVISTAASHLIEMMILMRSSARHAEEPDKLLNTIWRVCFLIIWAGILVLLRVDAAGAAVLRLLESLPVTLCLWGLAVIGTVICVFVFRACVTHMEQRYQKV